MRWKPDLTEADATPEALYLRRRDFLKLGAAGALGLALPAGALAEKAEPTGAPLAARPGPKAFDTDERKTPWQDVTTYNNFYELGTSKDDPAQNGGAFVPRPWAVTFDGEVKRPQTVDLDALEKWFPVEERIYRMRCVEAWSMVIPWDGIPLADLVKRLEPTSRAKYVAFQSVLRPAELPGQRTRVLEWPYVEGLRLDEATNPLTLLAFGLYGRALPNQNGAPVRLVVPWKYGFKGIKSIVRVSFVERQPPTTWSALAPNEYGFYANVNPAVDHPRWSQAKERRIGELWKRPTLPFNGYGAFVADLYRGMDAAKLY